MGKEILHQGEVSVSVGTDASRPWEGMEDVCRGLTPVRSQAPHSHSLTPRPPAPAPGGMGRRIGKEGRILESSGLR